MVQKTRDSAGARHLNRHRRRRCPPQSLQQQPLRHVQQRENPSKRRRRNHSRKEKPRQSHQPQQQHQQHRQPQRRRIAPPKVGAGSQQPPIGVNQGSSTSSRGAASASIRQGAVRCASHVQRHQHHLRAHATANQPQQHRQSPSSVSSYQHRAVPSIQQHTAVPELITLT